MAKKKGKKKVRAEPKTTKDSSVAFCTLDNWDMIVCDGYTPLSQNAEVVAAVGKIADLVSSMTVHLMQNTDDGDVRIQDEFAKKVDIDPNPYMTRKTFMSAIVKNLLLDGDGNSYVLPVTRQGLLDALYPLPSSMVSSVPDGRGYRIYYAGCDYSPDEMIHVVINPDPQCPWKGTGYRASLRGIVNNLEQATATKAGFMQSKWKPSIIVKVDGMIDEFSSPQGRKQLLERYVESTEAGEPWLIPADQFEVETVKPLSLQDLAINDAVELDKRTVASIIDVPPFVLGVGEFKADEWNNFINTRIRGICNAIEQAFTKTLIYSPRRYFKFNNRSIYAYDIKTINDVCASMCDHMAMRRNEWREWIGFSPDPQMNELLALENYVPADRLGDQKKLKGGDSGGEKNVDE